MRPIVVDRNCSVAEVAVRLSATMVVATIYKCHPTCQQRPPRYSYPSSYHDPEERNFFERWGCEPFAC